MWIGTRPTQVSRRTSSPGKCLGLDQRGGTCPVRRYAIGIVVGCLIGCSHRPSLVGTWTAVGPLKETQTLKLTAQGTYESVIRAVNPKGSALRDWRKGTYELQDNRLFQTQLANITMAGTLSLETVDLPATKVRWISDNEFEAIETTGSLVFTRAKPSR
jgi:hypothetical protein